MFNNDMHGEMFNDKQTDDAIYIQTFKNSNKVARNRLRNSYS